MIKMKQNNIDNFIDVMYSTLPLEIIEYIVIKYIFLPYNKGLIVRQKDLKTFLLEQLLFISNIIYIDNNICIYANDNSIVFHTNNINSHATLYGNQNYIEDIVNDNDILLNDNDILLNEIENRLEQIQSTFQNIFTPSAIVSTSNIIIDDMEYSNLFDNNIYPDSNDIILNTTHNNMNDVSVYIVYI